LYNSNYIAERIKLLAKTKKITLSQMLDNVGLGFNTMTHMKNSMPKSDTLAKIADYLDCSIDYLMGRTDVVEVTKGDNTVISISELQSFIDKSTHTAQIAADTGKKQSPHPVDFDTLVEISKEEQNK